MTESQQIQKNILNWDLHIEGQKIHTCNQNNVINWTYRQILVTEIKSNCIADNKPAQTVGTADRFGNQY